MKLFLKRLFWVAVIGGVLFLLVMTGAGWRYGCVASRYERFDMFVGGVQQRGFSGGAPAYSIADTPLIPSSLKARSAFYNVTDLIDCEEEEKSAARISYIELRSAALTRVVERWRSHHDPAFGFRSGNLLKERVIVSYDSYWSHRQVWDAAYIKATKPDWVPLEQLNEANMIAFWGDGHLFQGTQPDQYYWVGYH